MKDRKDILLRAAFDLIKRNYSKHFVESAAETIVRYDEADCDGLCLMGDIALELGIEPETEPLPIELP